MSAHHSQDVQGPIEDEALPAAVPSAGEHVAHGGGPGPFSGWIVAGPGVYVNPVELARMQRRDAYLELEWNWEDVWT